MLKTLCLKVMASFANHLGLCFFGELSMDKRDSSVFLKESIVCIYHSMDSTDNSTDSSLVAVNCKLRLLVY